MSNIIFNKLMNIKMLHEYYANGICNALSIQVSAQTQSLLQGYGLLFKPTSQGALVLYESIDESGTPKIPIDSPLKFTFFFSSNSLYFTNFTDVEFSDDPSSLYYFSNIDPEVVEIDNNYTIVNGKLSKPVSLITKYLKVTKVSGTASYVILTDVENNDSQIDFNPDEDTLTIKLLGFQDGKYELKQFSAADVQIGTTSTYYYNKGLSGTIPFAVFELFIDENDMLSLPINFIFDFKSRDTLWRYKVLTKEAVPATTEYTIDSETISIEHNPIDDEDKISFEDASGSNPIVIRSTNKIKLKEKGFDLIGLLHGEENILISSLPNASPVKLEKEGDDWYSDIYVYVYV